MDQTKHILRTARKFATAFLKEKISPLLSFHNYNHTLEVVFAARQIADHCKVSAEQSSIIQIAAWFHDCGYSVQYKGHENNSKEIAADFLEGNNCSQNLIDKVLSCIDATHYPQAPCSPE